MKKNFYEDSMFLCRHKSIKEFAMNFCAKQQVDENVNWSVVCERKEDLIVIRNQLFYQIEKYNPACEKTNSVMGISMYTLDSLARNFCATLASTNNKKIQSELPEFINKPYIDVVTQENFLEIILQLFGYTSSDTLPLAKQILSLIDTCWPKDLNFIQLMINTQEKEHIRSIQEINELALRQIMAVYQYATLELRNYARLQSLVNEYLQITFRSHLMNKETQAELELPIHFLKGHILWVSAPEYTGMEKSLKEEIPEHDCIKPGNFQSIIVHEFKNAILEAREILNFNTSVFYNSRTIISHKQNAQEFAKNNSQDINRTNISYWVADNKHSYFDQLKLTLADKNNLTLLADFDPGSFKETRSDAGGSYAITCNDIEAWQNNNINYTDSDKIFPKINDLFKNYLNAISLISKEDTLSYISNNYGLKYEKINNNSLLYFFKKNIENETIFLESPHPIAECPRALSYLNGENLPNKIIAAGRAHAPTSSSFHVKVLNNAISILRRQGVIIDLPASEIMYRGFWQNLCTQNIPIEFWLENSEELANFPSYLKPEKNILALGEKLPTYSHSHLYSRLNLLSQNPSFLIPDWKTRFFKTKDSISITEFERYILCPFQYFLSDFLAIKKIKNENLSIDNMAIGSKMHSIAEQIVTKLVITLGNKNYSSVMYEIYKNILENLKDENLFISPDKEIWHNLFISAIDKTNSKSGKQIITIFKDIIDLLWQFPESKKSLFEKNVERETVKRTFYRFLMLEKIFTENIPNKKTGVERERNIKLKLGQLTFIGKIDRIDATPDGLHIIDYKTSKASKQTQKLTLLPSKFKHTQSGYKLSVQGGLYSLAWAAQKLLNEEEDYHHCIKSFSLFQLKNLDEDKNIILEYEFSPPMVKDGPFYTQLYEEYSEYATNLAEGNFFPNPINSAQCTFCDYKSICPVSNKYIAENEESENDG
ncbi:RecB family exonuclease [Fluviispira vulneris]|uniref:RecB family exonuclease n=1 Tax=Fluviispira vulneris TaxID=2763012 RepID=UPI00164665AF|nr:PD-(D/E)XK nuclease family protein [Fluviispira vulneris]